MGLFGPKKICSICGGKVGFFGYDLAGDDHLCGNCRDKCTPGNLDFSSMTVRDVKKNMKIAEENKAAGQEDFQATYELYTGKDFDKPVIFIDEDNGWFMNAARDDGWVYCLDDITSYRMRITTTKDDEEEEKGFLEWLFEPDFYSDFPDLPRVPDGQKLTGAYLKIKLADNELGVDEIEIDVFPGLFTDEDDVRASYQCCQDFYDFMDEYRSGGSSRDDDEEEYEDDGDDDADRIRKLHDLMEDGIITRKEFEAKKKEILGL